MNAEEALRYCMEKELAENGAILVMACVEKFILASFSRQFYDNGLTRVYNVLLECISHLVIV